MTDLDAEFRELQQALEGLQHATRRDKTRRAVLFAGPQYPTQAQKNKLAGLLGLPSPGSLESFVRFANGYEPGRLTRIHFIHAIDLAMNGRNLFGTSEELVALSADPDMVIEPDVGGFQKRMIARRKAGMKKAGAGNARHMAPTMKELDAQTMERAKRLAADLEAARIRRLRGL